MNTFNKKKETRQENSLPKFIAEEKLMLAWW